MPIFKEPYYKKFTRWTSNDVNKLYKFLTIIVAILVVVISILVNMQVPYDKILIIFLSTIAISIIIFCIVFKRRGKTGIFDSGL